MFIFGGSSPLWLTGDAVSGCGLFTGGSNVFHAGYHHYEYADVVGSRTIIG